MQHLLVYTKAQSASASLAALTALADPAIPTDQSGRYLLPQQMQLLAALVAGTNITAAQVNSPYFRRTFLPSLWPLVSGVTWTTDPNIIDYRTNPMTLPALEGIEVDTSNGSGTNQHVAGLFIADTLPQNLNGSQVYSLAFTSSITSVAYTFVSGSMTLSQTLPQGQYALVGAQVCSATIMFARFLMPGMAYRPGVVGTPAVTGRPPWQGRKQPMGVMGSFYSTSLPQLEIFCSGADTAGQVGSIDLVKIA